MIERRIPCTWGSEKPYYASARLCYGIIKLKYMSSLFSRKKELSPAQIERFANIFDNAGQVFLAVMVLTPIIQGIDYSSILVIILGVLDTALCWGLSLILAKRKDKQGT